MFIYIPVPGVGLRPPENFFQLIVAGMGAAIIVGAVFYIVYLVNEVLVGHPITELLFRNCGFYYGRGAAVFRVFITIVAMIGEAVLIAWLSGIPV